MKLTGSYIPQRKETSRKFYDGCNSRKSEILLKNVDSCPNFKNEVGIPRPPIEPPSYRALQFRASAIKFIELKRISLDLL